ncbi:hypothetical protein [Rossellomorea aquimaris]|uniref:Uncharacterized protein n=1 Tax=Rossellomorea aquimaris TaxID=189382 RepID=A0A5D4TNZ5_9BACI|nr:hypothetical protein [Rossellomorea aquimaris]TYS75766.1 hypothetical protein FZC80_16320 [Rossellomorea aquimaris]
MGLFPRLWGTDLFLLCEAGGSRGTVLLLRFEEECSTRTVPPLSRILVVRRIITYNGDIENEMLPVDAAQ